MPTWNAAQYLQFASERIQPCRDLVSRLARFSPRQIIDLGCGPGNSTSILSSAWPSAQIVGLDSSFEMIDAARRELPTFDWVVADIAAWARTTGEPSHDLIFSNAALQWVDRHADLLPRLMNKLYSGGALAVQVPSELDAPPHRAMRELASSEAWTAHFPTGGVREWHVEKLTDYYDILSPHSARLEMWETEYIHVMSGPEAIVEWYKGTGLRPFLDRLTSEELKEQFIHEYLQRIRAFYRPRPDGRLLFPFRRLFMIAYRPGHSTP